MGWLEAESRAAENRAFVVAAWSGDRSRTGDAPLEVGKRAYRLPESIFGILQAERLADTLDATDEALLSRFLYCWPVPGWRRGWTAPSATPTPMLGRCFSGWSICPAPLSSRTC